MCLFVVKRQFIRGGFFYIQMRFDSKSESNSADSRLVPATRGAVPCLSKDLTTTPCHPSNRLCKWETCADRTMGEARGAEGAERFRWSERTLWGDRHGACGPVVVGPRALLHRGQNCRQARGQAGAWADLLLKSAGESQRGRWRRSSKGPGWLQRSGKTKRSVKPRPERTSCLGRLLYVSSVKPNAARTSCPRRLLHEISRVGIVTPNARRPRIFIGDA